MHKTKKKSKTAKLPKPIKVKKEKSDEDRLPQPMTHYLDDRLEMVKQIFNTLKPKTIVNLAPEFLKTQSLEEIEEACLNELLCISTKRLKSIITATKCPTDTESSDNDSDVERHEEHISLEEISSDSEIEGSGSKKVKKKKPSKARDESEATKKDTDKIDADNPDDGQITVLELLELQARARAIRSQLALEPVTKIEVDSDGEKRNDEKNNFSNKNDKIERNERKRISSERESRDSAKMSRISGSTESLNTKDKEQEKRTSKKIKLKRTHRISTNKKKEDEENPLIEKKNDNSKDCQDKRDTTVKENSKEQDKHNKNKEFPMTDIKKEKTSRSPSPDVIPIVAEPETLLITDSSDEENGKSNKKVVENDNKDQPLREVKEQETTIENDIKETTEKEKSSTEKNGAQTEMESNIKTNVSTESSTENTQDSEFKMSDTVENKDTQGGTTKTKTKTKELNKEKEKSKSDEANSANHSDDDQNDDVISLGGDLESEMNEQLENEVNSIQSPFNKKSTEESSQDNIKSQDESQTEDVISLESSDTEHTDDNQSWHSRYMKSSKVSKVLAASRLGKRVRDKIKKSKHSKKDKSHENDDAEKEKTTPVFTSKHEDGSIEQYKELLEMRQRKSSQ
ncbi:uncharacterized protein ACRADG_002525 [Cochliomyia hominivorax]